jgi:hypothetical protein
MFKEFGIINSYTLECSLCGPNIGSKKEFHFSKKTLFVGRLFSINSHSLIRKWESSFAKL